MARLALVLVTLTLLGLALAGPADNSLVIGTSQEPPVIGADPHGVVATAAIATEIELYLVSGLYRMDINGQLQPNLVTEVATVENGRLRFFEIADGQQRLEIDLTLRDDIRWSDGVPITTEDVRLWYETGTHPDMPVASPDFYRRLSIEFHDARNFTVIMEPAQSMDLLISPAGILPAHVMRAAWEEARATADATPDPARKTEIFRAFFAHFSSAEAINQRRMVYSGAFVPTRWAPGSSIEMVRNPYFHLHPENQQNYVQRVTYRFITDTTALFIAIMGGGIDATSSVALTFDQALSPQLAARAPGRFDIWFVANPVWEQLAINHFSQVQQVSDLRLYDVRTRQALLYAVDRQALTDALFEGLQPVAHTNVPPAHPFFNPNVRQYNFNPERAAELLAELGWTPGPDGILQRATEDGRTVRFEIEFVTTAGNAVRERQQLFIAEDWRRVGIATRINNAPAGTVFAHAYINRASEGSWTGVFMHAWVSSPAAIANAALYICTAIPTAENAFAGQNTGGWCNPEYDALRNQAIREFDLEAAIPLYWRMQELFAEELPALPLIFRSTPLVTRVGLVNFVSSTFNNGFGYPPPQPWLVGWAARGAVQVYDQADFATRLER